MKFSDRCELYFGSKDMYEVLNIPRGASENEVRKAYYKLSLTCHPDRVGEDEKAEANEKFKVLGKIHSILRDAEKRAIYDESGEWGEDEDAEASSEEQDWQQYWSGLFNKITLDDIKQFEVKYKGSDEELEDLKKAFEKSKGDMDMIYELIPFSNYEEEGRIRALIQGLIDKEEVPAFDAFVNEPQAKRDRRMRKSRKEAKEAEKIAKRMKEDGGEIASLEKAILARQKSTASFLDGLEAKYADRRKKENPKKKSNRGKKQ